MKLKKGYSINRVRHFFFVVKLYLKRIPLFWLIVFITILAGLWQVISAALVVPIVMLFTNESPIEKTALINKYVTYFMDFAGLKPSIQNLLILMIVFECFSFLLVYIQQRCTYYSRAGFTRNIRNDMFNSFYKSQWRSILFHSSGEMASRFSLEVQRAGVASYLLIEVTVSLVFLVVFGVSFLLITWKIILLVTVLVWMSFFLTKSMRIKTEALGRDHTENNNKFVNLIIEYLQAIKLVKVSGLEDYTIGIFVDKSEKNIQIVKKCEDYSAKSAMIMTCFSSLSRGLIIFMFLLVFKIQLSLLTLILYFYLRVTPWITGFQSRFISYLSNCHALESIEEFLDTLITESKPQDNLRVFNGFRDGVVLKEVTFSYGNIKVLNKVSIDIEQKKITGITGPSGAGKSTLVDLLAGLHQPDEGKVTVDSTDIKEYQRKSWCERLGFVTQDDILFNDTIWNNLTFGYDEIDREWVEHCTRLANIHNTIIETPYQYDTVIGEKGVKLSGGQKQRLSLARALIRKPHILILDEATSSLDSESEKIIQSSIRKIASDMTIVIIAHRLSTLIDSDIIYVLEKGMVVEKGSYRDLSSGHGYFSRQHTLQTAVEI